jgi:hypothetical protein
MPTSPETNSGCIARHLDRVRVLKSDCARPCPLIGYSARITPGLLRGLPACCSSIQSGRPPPQCQTQRRAPASHALLRIGAARQTAMPQPEEGLDEDRRDEPDSVTVLCIASAIWGRPSRFKHGSALDVRDGKDYILELTRSERLKTEGPLGRSADCRLPEGKSKRARLGGLSAFWGWL